MSPAGPLKVFRQADSTATWNVVRFDGLPFLKSDCGYFVEVEVTVNGVRLSQIHPVLDARNKPIETPNAFEINTSIQRALVKAIALHGLGLYIYAGEDLPEGAANESQPQQPATEFVNAEQIARIKSLLTETGQTPQRLLSFLHVDALEQILLLNSRGLSNCSSVRSGKRRDSSRIRLLLSAIVGESRFGRGDLSQL